MTKAELVQKKLGWSSTECGQHLLGIKNNEEACQKWCKYKRSENPAQAASMYFDMILASIKLGVLDELLKAMEGKR